MRKRENESGISHVVIIMINKLWDLYAEIKRDPIKYIGAPDLERMEAFWNGAAIYNGEIGGDVYDRLPGFLDFLTKKYPDIRGAHGAAQNIWLNSKDQEEAFFRFYELLEEFLKTQGKTYCAFELRNIKGEHPVIKRDTTEAIWEMMNNHWTIRIALGRRSLNLLEAYLNGGMQYALCLENKKVKLLPEFDEYLSEKYKKREKFPQKNRRAYFYA